MFARLGLQRHAAAILLAVAAMLLLAPSAKAADCLPGWTHSASKKSCTPCPAKTYQSGDACQACGAGQLSDPGSTSCCSPTVYSSGTNASCTIGHKYGCKVGSTPALSSDGKTSVCTACAAGTYGFRARDAQQKSSDLTLCAPCPSGQTSKAGSASCHPNPPSPPFTCPPGSIYTANYTQCATCGPGTTPNRPHTACVPSRPDGTAPLAPTTSNPSAPKPPAAPGILETNPGFGGQGPAGTGTPLGGGGVKGPAAPK